VDRGKAGYNERSEPVGMAGVNLDITERKNAEEALRESEARFRALVTATSDALYRMSPDWREMSLLHGGDFLAGTKKANRAWLDEYIDPEDHPRMMTAIEEAIRAKGIFEMEHRVRRRDGSVGWTFSRAVPLLDANGVIVEWFGAASDITERKRAEEALRDAMALAEQRAEELQRSNQDLEQFAYIASHDLQGPLRLISGFADLLKVDSAGKLTNQEDYYITVMADSAKNMSRMVGDLLSYSRVGSNDKQPGQIDMEAVLQATLAELGAAIRESGAAVTHDPLVTVWADETQMKQLLTNLIGNAIKFRKKTEPSRVHVSVERLDNYWRFSVRDNGIGIDRKFQDRIFAIFQRLHSEEQYPGTGIGLAICKRIVDRHGGKISIESEPGQGATFYFTIPDRG
jgi:signal transduction histidine kinase